MEVTLLLDYLSPQRAVFVWETDLPHLAAALRLHDWSPAIAAGRLVLLLCPLEQLAARLIDWLDRHGGHLCPDRIMMWPWSTPAELAACRSAVQQAYEQTERRRADALARAAAEYFAPTPKSSPAELPSPLAIFGLHARPELTALTDALISAANNLGLHPADVLVRGPDDVHPLGRLGQLRKQCPQPPATALLLDCVRQQVRDLCPAGTPAISWIGPAVHLPAALDLGPSSRNFLAATSSRVRDRIASAGPNRQTIPVIPYPCLASHCQEATYGQDDHPIDVLILADHTPTHPSPFPGQWHSHSQLWQILCDLLRAAIDRFTDTQAADLLTQAEHKASFRLDEPDHRKAVLAAIEGPVGNTILILYLSQLLSDNDIKFTLCGRGWSATPYTHLARTTSGLADSQSLLRQAKVVVYADVAGEVSLVPLLAAGNGAALLAKAHPRDTRPGGLATLLKPGKEIHTFHTGKEFLTVLRLLLADANRRKPLADAARARCLAEHMPDRRLRTLLTAATSCFAVCSGQS
jgi:hypothetical protein